MKKSLWALYLIILLAACNNSIELPSRLLLVKDSKPCSDSLFQAGDKENSRFVELVYSVANKTEEDLYCPLKTEFHENVESSIDVCLVNGKDTIRPAYKIKKVPYNKDIILQGDSMLVFVKLYNFYLWQKDWCNVDTKVDSIVSKIRLEYKKNKDGTNDKLKDASIKFEIDPEIIKIKELLPGENMDVM